MRAFMATQAEIEAAAVALLNVDRHGSIYPPATTLDGLLDPLEPQYRQRQARAALEAAERVRAEALPAKQDDAERARRYRARKRDGRDATPVTAVTESVTGVTAAAPDVTAVTRNVAPIDKIESEGAPILSSPDLLARLTDAADGNVAPAAIDVAPIQVLLAHGCDLELDVLPAVRDLATAATSIKRWDHPPLIRAILRGRDVRITPKGPPPSPRSMPNRHPGHCIGHPANVRLLEVVQTTDSL